MNKGRIEALTDGILAIAATIMVLELKIPEEPTLAALRAEGATFLAYIISFFMIYVMWNSHHNLFQKAEKISPTAFLLNGVWIFFITLVPFVTAWVGKSFMSTVPEFLYGLNMLMCRTIFSILYRCMKKDNPLCMSSAWSNRTYNVISYAIQIVSLALTFLFPPAAMIFVAVTSVITIVYMFKPLGKEK